MNKSWVKKDAGKSVLIGPRNEEREREENNGEGNAGKDAKEGRRRRRKAMNMGK